MIYIWDRQFTATMRFFKDFFKQFSRKDNSPGKPMPPEADSDFDKIAAAVRNEASICFSMDPEDKQDGIDVKKPLRTYLYHNFQLDLVELFDWIEKSQGITIDDDDWITTSSPNWENCSVYSITEIVCKKKAVRKTHV